MTQAVILAAGLGTRVRPLSARCPKPLLRIGQQSLIERHLERLRLCGYERVLVTCSYHSETLRLLASRWRGARMRVVFSHEGPHPLETGGGIRRALRVIGCKSVTLVNGDTWTEFEFGDLGLPPRNGMHLVMVPNPPQHPEGDFHLSPSGNLSTPEGDQAALTYSGIARLDTGFIEETSPSIRLADTFRELINQQRLTGQVSAKPWFDVGTPAAARELNARLHKYESGPAGY